jgi:hypothetical protein
MTRSTPPSDWIVYVVVLGTVAAMMYGKYLIGKGDEPIEDVIKEDIEKLEHEVEETIHEVENKIK